ncbi:hypothetical protein KUL72_20940 [Bradyrhizobium arachidis]|uniref:hypothetical protein n=1 Tax=Bradyrhizobium arachidis TaxID=858423 RepID=UPI00216255E9|nr:hypothetical protein [Bradyrhizobium arachidis]UVO33981.1 hypothetical protein KUL72_20940 [Bradyrhizobium arachidis]
MAKAPRVASLKEQELNRWCVEMAMKWPVVTTYGGNGVYSAGGGLPSQQSDADVIGRAAKIREWVKGS